MPGECIFLGDIMDAELLLGSVVVLYTFRGWLPVWYQRIGSRKKAGNTAIKLKSPTSARILSVPELVRTEVVVAGAAGSSDQLMGEAVPQPRRGPGSRALRPGPESWRLAAITVRTSHLGEARSHIFPRPKILARHGRPECPGHPQPRLAPQAPGLPSIPSRWPRPRIRGGGPGPGGCGPHGADVRRVGRRRALLIRGFGPF